MCIYLIIGVVLFSFTHLYPAIFVTNRQAAIGKIGAGPYKGIYSLLILISLILIVIGWRISEATYIFKPTDWDYRIALILMYPALFLFISARAGSNISRIIRHPQLSSIILWGLAHILSNGDSRSMLLFGAFVVWALVEMFFLNRRDGDWQKPDSLPFSRDIKVAIIALIAYTALVYGHGYFSGATLMMP